MVKKQLNLPAAIRSFTGYLEGTEKAAHTIKSYKLDLLAFERYLRETKGAKKWDRLDALTAKDLDFYHARMTADGLKSNTRRRKLMTLRKFLSYLSGRGKLGANLGKTLLTPQKIERIPLTLPYEQLLASVRSISADSEIHARNRVLLWTLVETGCLVSEVTRLKFDSFDAGGASAPQLAITGRATRTVPVSRELRDAVRDLRRIVRQPDPSWLFLGFNKFGPMGVVPMTPRGVELLVRSLAPHLGSADITPRTLRHSTVRHWLDEGMDRAEIQRRLGLKTAYAFRTLEPLLRPKGGRSSKGSNSAKSRKTRNLPKR